MWNESEAKRGSSEIASCLLHYVRNYISEDVNKLVVFSDNCGGQNKNVNLLLFYLRLIHQERLNFIKHYYMTPGHSFLPCDRDFGNFELFLKGKKVYSTPHYMELMVKCRSQNPFNVIKMDKSLFFYFDWLQRFATKRGFSGAGFKETRLLTVNSDYKMGFKIHPNFGLEEEILVKLQKGKSLVYNETDFNLGQVQLPLKYPQGVKIKASKLNDLKELCKYVPLKSKAFYEQIFAKHENETNLDDTPEIYSDDDLLNYDDY